MKLKSNVYITNIDRENNDANSVVNYIKLQTQYYIIISWSVVKSVSIISLLINSIRFRMFDERTCDRNERGFLYSILIFINAM